jgi:hypothetical protein
MNSSEPNNDTTSKTQITTTKNEPILETLAKTPYPAWTMATLCARKNFLYH